MVGHGAHQPRLCPKQGEVELPLVVEAVVVLPLVPVEVEEVTAAIQVEGDVVLVGVLVARATLDHTRGSATLCLPRLL